MNRKITALSILLLAGLVIAGAAGAIASVTETHAADTSIDTQSSVKENKADQETVDDGNEADESAQLQKDVKVTIEDAKKTALLAVPGTIVKTEQKNEKGNVVYNMEISNGKTISAVKIDSVTGKVLETEIED
jgi:uncharacterized membrane protein YkoI